MPPTSAAGCPARTPCGATASPSSPATCSSPARARSWPSRATGPSGCRPTRSSGSCSGRCTRPSGPQDGDDRVAFYLKVLSDKTGSLIAAAAQSGIIFSNGPVRVRAADGRRSARRSASPSSCSTTSSTSPPTPTRPERCRAPTCARACRRCRISCWGSGRMPHPSRSATASTRASSGSPPARTRRSSTTSSPSCASTRRRRPPSIWRTHGRTTAVDALAPLPDGAVREALTRFAQAVADRSS